MKNKNINIYKNNTIYKINRLNNKEDGVHSTDIEDYDILRGIEESSNSNKPDTVKIIEEERRELKFIDEVISAKRHKSYSKLVTKDLYLKVDKDTYKKVKKRIGSNISCQDILDRISDELGGLWVYRSQCEGYCIGVNVTYKKYELQKIKSNKTLKKYILEMMKRGLDYNNVIDFVSNLREVTNKAPKLLRYNRDNLVAGQEYGDTEILDKSIINYVFI